MLSIIMDNEPDPSLHHRRKLLLVAIALTTLYTQLATIMSLPAQNPVEGKAYWTEEDTTRLVQYLWEHRSECGDGGNFKNATLNAAAEHLEPHTTVGARKTAKHLRSKWQTVGTANNSSLVVAYTSIAAQSHLSSYCHLQRHHVWDPLG
jgi:hypothetical protein